MLRYLRQQKLLLALTFVFGIIVSAGGVLIAIILQKVIDAALLGDWTLFRNTLMFTVAYLVLLCCFSYVFNLLSKKLIRNLIVAMRGNVFSGLFGKGAATFNETNTADYLSALTNDIKQLEENYINPLLSILQHGIIFLVSLAVLLYLSPLVTGLTIGCILLMLIVPSIFGKALQTKQNDLSAQMSHFTTRLKDLLIGFEVLASFGMRKQAVKQFEQENRKTGDVRYQVDRLFAVNESISGTLAIVTQLSVVFIAAYLIMKGQLSGGSLVALVQLSGGLVGPVLVILEGLPRIQGIKPIADRLNQLAAPASETTHDVEKRPKSATLTNAIMLRDVQFSYEPDQQQPTLTGVNLTIHRGKKYALVGKSGTGKSTLVKLLSGYYDQYEGKILLDGVDTKVSGREALSAVCSSIHQQVYLFDTDIKHNISLYDEYTDAELNEALAYSGIAEFVHQLPEGIHAPVGENGSLLSGGQRQRLALARAFIRKKPVLILDEGTSAIDTQTAFEIESRLLRDPDLTLITITHRMDESLLASYDEIIYMEDGRIVEQGSLQQLLQWDGQFKRFYDLELLEAA